MIVNSVSQKKVSNHGQHLKVGIILKVIIVVAGQENPHNVHLAPEYEYKAKHLMKAHKN